MPLQASQGQGSCTSNQGRWTRHICCLKVPALYIPNAKVKMISVNSLGNIYPEEIVTFHPRGATMTGVPGDPTEDESTLQEIQAIIFQPHTPMSMEGSTRHPISWPTLF